MAANKEAIAIVLDVGPSMNSAPPGVVTPLETSLEAITMILQRKMFAELKDEIALILIGSEDTDNPLADEENYKHIAIVKPLGIVDFNFLKFVQNDIKASTVNGDFLDGIVVGMDHLMTATEGKKGFNSKRIILMSDFSGEFLDDQLKTILAGIRNSQTELNVIGPDLDDDGRGDGAGETKTSQNNESKSRTTQQCAGIAMIKRILDEVEGECYSFSEVLPALSIFQSRQINATAWKCPLEIGPELKIPICGYVMVKDYKLKQSWKQVYAKNPDMEIGKLRTYHKNDEEETEVDVNDMVEGHHYGNTLVPVSKDDKLNMKYKAEKCFKVLGFTKSDNVKRHEMMGDGVMTVIAEKGDETAAVALSALIKALYETSMVAIVRRVYDGRCNPKVGCLIPHIKADYECLYWFELPFMEDVRQFTFGSLPVKVETLTNKKYKPTEEQLSVIDSLITDMDLSTAAIDENGKPCEVLKPKTISNPYFQRLYQCLQHRALNPDDPLPELSPIIASYLKPPQEVMTKCTKSLDKIKQKFKLEEVKKKEEKTGEDMFKENEQDGKPISKKLKFDNSLDGGMADLVKAKVNKVGSTTPVDDFIAIINMKDEDRFEEACGQMQKRIEQMVLDSFGEQLYEKAIACLKCLREQCIQKLDAISYNTFVKEFKETLISKSRRNFFDKICNEKLGLISKRECEDGVPEDESKQFDVKQEVKNGEGKMQDSDSDNLYDEL